MKVTVQVVLHTDDDSQTVVREVFTLTREALAPDTVGLHCRRPKTCSPRYRTRWSSIR
jgi:hypothetical protein